MVSAIKIDYIYSMGFSDLEIVMKSLFNGGKYADMTITCQGHTFNVHRAIVCSQSPFFDAALKDGFKVSDVFNAMCIANNNLKEADLSHVDLPHDDVDTISRVLSFCYFQDYGQADDIEPVKMAKNHFLVYLAADKFGILPLQELATTRIVNWTKSNWALKNFAELAEEIWCSTPPHELKLRALVVETFATHAQHFLNLDEGKMVLVENPQLAIEVLKQVAEENEKFKKTKNAYLKSKFGAL